MDARAGRRVFLDVGGHVGESLSVAMQPRWRFERIWTFEPTASCAAELEAMSDRRVTVVPAGWWSSDMEMDVHDPGRLHASVLPEASVFGQVERCRFVDAGRWMADNISERDTVWLKINVEASEVEVLERLLDTGEIRKVDHLVVHFDVDKLGRASDAIPVRRRLGEAGIEWREAKDVMFGRTDQQKVATWLAWTEGRRAEFVRHKWEHQIRRRVWRARRRIGSGWC
jgi:FkbM family methyltransferase